MAWVGGCKWDVVMVHDSCFFVGDTHVGVMHG